MPAYCFAFSVSPACIVCNLTIVFESERAPTHSDDAQLIDTIHNAVTMASTKTVDSRCY